MERREERKGGRDARGRESMGGEKGGGWKEKEEGGGGWRRKREGEDKKIGEGGRE